MKKFVLVSFLLIVCVGHLNAQTDIEPLLDSYVQKRIQNEDVTFCMAKLENYFKNSTKNPSVFFNQITKKIQSHRELGNTFECIALIDLYSFFAIETDENLPGLYYEKGCICANLSDTTQLKECISDLQLLKSKGNAACKTYIDQLNTMLLNIQNYIPVTERMDGVWIAIGQLDRKSGLPAFILEIKTTPEGEQSYRMIGQYYFYSTAQKVVEFGNNKAFMIWSNEKLNIPDQDLKASLTAVSTDLGYTIGNSLISGSSLMDNITGDILGGVCSKVLGSLIDGLFKPSKKILIAACTFELLNNYNMEANIQIKEIDVKGNGNSEPQDFKYEKIIFTKWDSSADAYFDDSFTILFPTWDTPKNVKKTIKKDPRYNYRLHRKLYNQFWPYWYDTKRLKRINYEQTVKLGYFNRHKAIKEGYKYGNIELTYMGCLFESTSEETPSNKPVIIKDIIDFSPAYIYKLKKGDIILSVEGYDVHSPQEVIDLIRSFTPFETITLRIQRGKKQIDKKVELSVRYFNYQDVDAQ